MPIYIDTAAERNVNQVARGNFYVALGNLNGDPLSLPDIESNPTAARFVTCGKYAGLSNGAVLTSGVPTLTPIWVPAGTVISNITVLSATTAAG